MSYCGTCANCGLFMYTAQVGVGTVVVGTCRTCDDKKSIKREEEIKKVLVEKHVKDYEELKAFLRISPPWDLTPGSTGFTDVALVPTSADLPENILPAHKAVLVARSPVFRAMLEENREMAESLTGMIKISDISPDTLRAFINYLYTAETSPLDEQMARDLLVLAEKYDVKHLKSHCEKFLVSKLEWSNSVNIFEFAHMHNAGCLAEASLSIITDKMDELKKTEEYSQLLEKDPKLVVKILESYISKQPATK